MPKSKPPYPPEFRREALELIRISDKPIAQIAKDLGVTDQTLRNWKRQAEIDAGKAEGLTTDERDLVEVAQNKVLVTGRHIGEGLASGVEIERWGAIIYTFRRGKIFRVDAALFSDRDSVSELVRSTADS